MKTMTIIILALALLLPSDLMAGNQKEKKAETGKKELQWRTFDAGLAEAAKTKKKLLVDLYTDWCKWCKKMDKEVYTHPEVVDYLNKNYVVVKVDGEGSNKLTYKGQQMSEIAFAQSVGITGYPATLFFTSKGEYITPAEGYLAADRFLPILKFIGENHYEKMSWEEYQAMPPKKEAKKEVSKKKK